MPNNVKPLTDLEFRIDCMSSIILAKFSSNNESSSNLFTGMLTPKYSIEEFGQDKPLIKKEWFKIFFLQDRKLKALELSKSN